MQRVLFIFDIVFYGTPCRCVTIIDFSWVGNRWVPDIATEEVAAVPIDLPLSEFDIDIDLSSSDDADVELGCFTYGHIPIDLDALRASDPNGFDS